eukprot:TRINITY_DN27068_c0_g1_i2.p2 TRINITY_DN27068_c0_g1~~TRINITY_DN27068_c0_g1_i2.p2  ORF type:complete len:152 (+),score=11.20 TRINITY_DN27068_c0_g1_i2:98-553(+)
MCIRDRYMGPGSITPHTKFKAEVYVLTKEEGGRHTPFFTGYRPQFYFRTTDITGSINLPEGVEMVMPGDNIEMVIELIHPIAMEKGGKFAIREGGRTVGAGVVAEVIAQLNILVQINCYAEITHLCITDIQTGGAKQLNGFQQNKNIFKSI